MLVPLAQRRRRLQRAGVLSRACLRSLACTIALALATSAGCTEAGPEYSRDVEPQPCAYELLPDVPQSPPPPRLPAVYTDRRRLVVQFNSTNIQRLGLLPSSLFNASALPAASPPLIYRYVSVVPPSGGVDWRTKGVVTAVKTQGQCESCWALAVADAIASLRKIASPSVPAVDLSAQQICDCGNAGKCCSGGWPAFALDYVVANGGLDVASDYAYRARNQACNAVLAAKHVGVVTAWELVPARSLLSVKQALANHPVVVTLDASSPDFQSYTSGIFDSSSCGNTVNHAMLAIGYGFDSATQKPYLLLKNSWGASWGESGYMRLAAYEGAGLCGVLATNPLYAVHSNATNPCDNLPNPCATGKCVPAGGAVGYACQCPSGYTQYTSGTVAGPKCVLANPCNTNPNPCGAGTCTPAPGGVYSCRCPSNTIVGARSDGQPTCVFGQGASGVRVYWTYAGDTCQSIYTVFNLTLTFFAGLNPGIDCSRTLTPGIAVAVSNDSCSVGCLTTARAKAGDNCTTLASQYNVASAAAFQAANPGINCTGIKASQLVCVLSGGLAHAAVLPPRCGQSIDRNQTGCTSCSCVMSKYQLDSAAFAALNPGFNCSAGLPITICIANYTADSASIDCAEFVRVNQGETCGVIQARYNLTDSQFAVLNPGLLCDYPRLQVGQPVCISPPKEADYVNRMPYKSSGLPNETLPAIAQSVALACGPVASPANICWANHLQNCSAPLPNNTLIQIPCQWPVGRYCGCPAGSPVCGWDGKIYQSLCDAICNYGTPTYAPVNGACNPCAAACGGKCFGPPAITAPSYCFTASRTNPCPYPPFPPITYSCNDYLMECQRCCFSLGYGSHAFNTCFANCRRYKC
eukprot:SM000013S26461  [mRNA]  locus=s13:532172:535297:+ [translate_table: standard]